MKLEQESAKLVAHISELHEDYKDIQKTLVKLVRKTTPLENKLLLLCRNMLNEMERLADITLDVLKKVGMDTD